MHTALTILTRGTGNLQFPDYQLKYFWNVRDIKSYLNKRAITMFCKQ